MNVWKQTFSKKHENIFLSKKRKTVWTWIVIRSHENISKSTEKETEAKTTATEETKKTFDEQIKAIIDVTKEIKDEKAQLNANELIDHHQLVFKDKMAGNKNTHFTQEITGVSDNFSKMNILKTTYNKIFEKWIKNHSSQVWNDFFVQKFTMIKKIGFAKPIRVTKTGKEVFQTEKRFVNTDRLEEERKQTKLLHWNYKKRDYMKN